MVFCAAFKNIDLKKSLKYTFWITLSGCILLVVLAVTGIFGNMYIVDEGDRGIRYCFGLGHPNAFYCMYWVLVTLGIYLYWEKMKSWIYALIFLAGIWLYFLTNSRTGIIILLFSLLLSLFLAYGKNIRDSRWVYIAGIAAFLFCVGMSVWMAYYEPMKAPFTPMTASSPAG